MHILLRVLCSRFSLPSLIAAVTFALCQYMSEENEIVEAVSLSWSFIALWMYQSCTAIGRDIDEADEESGRRLVTKSTCRNMASTALVLPCAFLCFMTGIRWFAAGLTWGVYIYTLRPLWVHKRDGTRRPVPTIVLPAIATFPDGNRCALVHVQSRTAQEGGLIPSR
jgi:hypothetical protein